MTEDEAPIAAAFGDPIAHEHAPASHPVLPAGSRPRAEGTRLEDPAAETHRPGRFRRFAAGAWHVPGGAMFLLRHPRLWGLAAAPALIGLIGLGAGLILGVYGIRAVEMHMGVHRSRLFLDLLGVVALWTGTLGSGMLVGAAAALFVSAPLLAWLGRRTEAAAGGSAATTRPLRPEALGALGRSLHLVAALPIIFVLSVVPLVGPLLAALLLVFVLPFQLTAPGLSRRGKGYRDMLQWHRTWRAESLGFGVATIVLLPPLLPLLLPALTVGAALLVYEIEGDPGGDPTGGHPNP